MHRKKSNQDHFTSARYVHFINSRYQSSKLNRKSILWWYICILIIHRFQMSYYGLNKGQVSLAARDNWLNLNRNNPRLTVKLFTFTFNTICFVAKREFVLKSNTNLPFIKTKRHMHRFLRIATSFQRVAHLEWKCVNAITFLTVCWETKKTKKKAF